MSLTPEEMEELATPPFATVDDLQDRYKELDEEEVAAATVLLEDASYVILADLPYGWEKRERVLRLLKPITCSVVKRQMASKAAFKNADGIAASQMSLTTGQVTQQISLANPYGTMKLTPEEKRLLGITRQRIKTIDPLICHGWPQSNGEG